MILVSKFSNGENLERVWMKSLLEEAFRRKAEAKKTGNHHQPNLEVLGYPGRGQG